MSTTSAVPPEACRARPQPACFVCGQENARGLRIRFERAAGSQFSAEWIPEAAFEGFSGIVHGGIVSTVLDEAMSKAVSASGAQALTAELKVRFRLPVRAGERFQIRGWIAKQNRRLTETESVLVGAGGTEYAHAWARFLPLGRRRQPL